mgnify:CR=1 FL=1
MRIRAKAKNRCSPPTRPCRAPSARPRRGARRPARRRAGHRAGGAPRSERDARGEERDRDSVGRGAASRGELREPPPNEPPHGAIPRRPRDRREGFPRISPPRHLVGQLPIIGDAREAERRIGGNERDRDGTPTKPARARQAKSRGGRARGAPTTRGARRGNSPGRRLSTAAPTVAARRRVLPSTPRRRRRAHRPILGIGSKAVRGGLSRGASHGRHRADGTLARSQSTIRIPAFPSPNGFRRRREMAAFLANILAAAAAIRDADAPAKTFAPTSIDSGRSVVSRIVTQGHAQAARLLLEPPSRSGRARRRS